MTGASSQASPAGPSVLSTDRVIRHHGHLLSETVTRMFEVPPASFTTFRSPADRGLALGACLYMPATMPDLGARAADLAARVGLTSVVVCLEDSIADAHLEDAESNLLNQIELMRLERLPLHVFVRPRSPSHLTVLVERLGPSVDAVAGFALPKFSSRNCDEWIDAVSMARNSNPDLVAMPILEGSEILDPSTRLIELDAIVEMLVRSDHLVSCIRIGATDLSGILGIRRSRALTVYEIPSLANAIGDIVMKLSNMNLRQVVSGPVWEFYHHANGGFPDHGLVRETQRDIETGLVGKSVIHPSQVRVVNALLTVTWSDWMDAQSILASGTGASASTLRDRMNEAGPHRYWAERLQQRAAIFGVLRAGVDPIDLVGAV